MANIPLIHAQTVVFCMEFVMPWLVCPNSLATVLVLGWRSLWSNRFLDTLPLLLTQLSSAFMWGCLLVYNTAQWNYKINHGILIKGDLGGFRDQFITSLL